MEEGIKILKAAIKYLKHKSGSIKICMELENFKKLIPKESIINEINNIVKGTWEELIPFDEKHTMDYKKALFKAQPKADAPAKREADTTPKIQTKPEADKPVTKESSKVSWADQVEQEERGKTSEDILNEVDKNINMIKYNMDKIITYENTKGRIYKYRLIDTPPTDRNIVDPRSRDVKGVAVYDKINTVSSEILKHMFEIVKPYLDIVRDIVETHGEYEFHYRKFENPESNIVYYENLTSNDIYKSYMSMSFSYASNVHAQKIQKDITEYCAKYNLYPLYYANKKYNVEGSTTCILRLEIKH